MGGASPAASNRLKVEGEKPPLLAIRGIGSTMSSSVGGGRKVESRGNKVRLLLKRHANACVASKVILGCAVSMDSDWTLSNLSNLSNWPIPLVDGFRLVLRMLG